MATRNTASKKDRETIASLLDQFRKSDDLAERDAIGDRLAGHPSPNALLAAFDAMATKEKDAIGVGAGTGLLLKTLARARVEATAEHGALIRRLLGRKDVSPTLRSALLMALAKEPSRYWFEGLMRFADDAANALNERLLALAAMQACEPMDEDIDRVLPLLDAEESEVILATLTVMSRWHKLNENYDWHTVIDRAFDLITCPNEDVRVAAIGLLAEIGEIDHAERLLLFPKAITGTPAVLGAIKGCVERMLQRDLSILRVNPRNFEWLVGQYLRFDGFSVKLGPEGPDGGVDVEATKVVDGKAINAIVQCKRHSNRAVGEQVVQAIIDKLVSTDTVGFVFTTSTFTEGASDRARVFGRKHPDRLHLVDGRGLMERLDERWTHRFNRRHRPNRR